MSKTLVAYFSATGTTARVAKMLAETIGADLHEIQPKQPYTSADLNWNDRNSRSSRESNDPSSRPAVANTVENMPQYDHIFIGFPIWWYTAPAIIHTFLEQYDLSGKTVIPFATSGGSGMGKTSDDLRHSCPGADVKDGKRLNAGITPSELKKWVSELGF